MKTLNYKHLLALLGYNIFAVPAFAVVCYTVGSIFFLFPQLMVIKVLTDYQKTHAHNFIIVSDPTAFQFALIAFAILAAPFVLLLSGYHLVYSKRNPCSALNFTIYDLQISAFIQMALFSAICYAIGLKNIREILSVSVLVSLFGTALIIKSQIKKCQETLFENYLDEQQRLKVEHV